MRSPLTISEGGLSLLKAYEKFSLDVYFDEARRPTIYWGHLVLPNERFKHTQEEGDTILVKDLAWVDACLHAWCPIDLAQNEYDALGCFVFNAGGKAFQTSTLRKLLLAGDHQGAADQFLRWDKEHDARTGQLIESPGLLKRRTAERALFLGQPWSPP